MPDHLCFTWSATLDRKQRKFNCASNYRYGLNFLVNRQLLHVFLLILLAGDVATNPGPQTDPVTCDSHAQNKVLMSRENSHRNSKPCKLFRCLSWNTRSLFSSHKATNGEVTYNHSSLQDLIYSEKIDLLFLSETWLTRKHFNEKILPPDCDVFRTDRDGKTGGGVLTAAKKESFIETKQIFFKQNADLEIVCVECTLKRARILAVCCYRPPNSSWLLSFKEFLDSISDRSVRKNYH